MGSPLPEGWSGARDGGRTAPRDVAGWMRLAVLLGVLPGVALASLLLTARVAEFHLLWLAGVLAVSTVGVAGTAWAVLEQVRRRESAIAERERALASLGHERAEARRLELVAQLAAGLAHEIGQPLSSARVAIEGLHYLRQLGREPDRAFTERSLDRVGRAILAITETIEHLRTLAGGQGSSTPVVVDVGATITAVMGERDRWLRYQEVTLEWVGPPEPVLAIADPVGLRLVLVNLLRNAAEAVADQAADRRRVSVTLMPQAGRAGPLLTVSDQGSGIVPEHLPRLFDPFFSTKAGAVRGIGLSLAKASLAAMGGTIAVVSDVGAGTTFSVQLAPAS
jgi:C4-dicarboxylate-specific signal transduction histidine kinase